MSEDQSTVPGQLSDIHSRLCSGEKRMGDIETRQKAMLAEIVANTVVTTEIRDYMVAGRIGTKVLVWVGVVAGACTGIWTALYAATHGGKMPHP